MRGQEGQIWGDLKDAERQARRAVIRLIAGVRTPGAEALAGSLDCSPAEARRLLEALAAKGCAVRDGTRGGIVAAYPLSLRPTRHRVTLAGAATVYALCGVDALGVSPLFGVPAAIEAGCPHCERTIRLRVEDGEVREREPPGAALWYTLADLLERPIAGLNLASEH